MTNIKFLLIGTSLSLIPSLTFAQCVATQDCETLGYTETSCNGGKGVKCPFGNKWACLPTKESICKEEGFTFACNGTGQTGGGDSCNGLYKKCSCNSPYVWGNGTCTCDSIYQYTCSGTGYSGGSGTACGGKYTACTCASGYEWKDGSCQKVYKGEAFDELYYCNGKVVGVKASDMNFYVAMKDLGKMNWTKANSQCQSYSFCGSVKGTLPTSEQLLTLYSNKSIVNDQLSSRGGTKITEDYHWSSTYLGNNNYDVLDLSNRSMTGRNSDADYIYARPVLTSW